MEENIKVAVSDFKQLLEKLQVQEKSQSQVGASFRARMREVISLIDEVGLIPALSFFYSKSTKSIYEEVLKAMQAKEKGNIKEEDSTKKGYALALYFTLKRISELRLIASIASLENPLNAFEELEGKQRLAFKLIFSYLLEIKRLAEATFEREER
jgi:CRISPR type III-B/RAMP module-associated protein Cmr5